MKIYLENYDLISGLVLTWLVSVWVLNMIDLFCLDGQEGAGMFCAVGVSVGDPHSYAVHLSQYCSQAMQLCQKTHSSVKRYFKLSPMPFSRLLCCKYMVNL